MDTTILILLWCGSGLLGHAWWQARPYAPSRSDLPDLVMAALLGPFTPLIGFLAQHIRSEDAAKQRVPVRVRRRNQHFER